jgi:hypothetical protein
MNRPLRFSFKTILEIEHKTGRPISEVASSGMMSDVLSLLHASLVTGYNKEGKVIDFDRDKVADWIDEADDLGALMAEIGNVLTNSLPKSSEEGDSESAGK